MPTGYAFVCTMGYCLPSAWQLNQASPVVCVSFVGKDGYFAVAISLAGGYLSNQLLGAR